MGSVHLNNTSRRGRKWNTGFASAIHSECSECSIRSEVDGAIKGMTIHGDVWPTIQNYWTFGKKHFDIVQRLLRETNWNGIFHHESIFQFFFPFSLFFGPWLLGFSKNSVYQPFGNRQECCFTEGRHYCFQVVAFTPCIVLTRGE